MIHEYVGNLHNHTTYSDGWGNHQDIAQAAIDAGLDFVVVTDHNVLVQGIDGYRHQDDRRVLLLTAEEIHDQARQPQKNHMLVYEVGEEIASAASDPQGLIDRVREGGGLCFLAHPVDPEAPLFDEGDLSWVSWQIDGYTGLEIWNFMTEFKQYLTSWPRAIYYAYRPEHIASGPYPEAISRWDQLLAAGKRVVAIGGADAHAMPVRKGPLQRVIFPYEFLYRAVNTHVLTEEPLTGDVQPDRELLFDAIRRGRCFVGYDMPATTRGFRFTAHSDQGEALMGDEIRSELGVTLQIRTPQPANIRLLCDGELIEEWAGRGHGITTVQRPGAYRTEASLHYKGEERTWILSNPIYVVND
ncbi:MAG: CehA/McbA family metallohydrolase [Anaerolineales bacterium]